MSDQVKPNSIPALQIRDNRTALKQAILHPDSPEAAALITTADALRAQTVGAEVHLRGLIEFSNYCRNNCLYCGLRRDNRQINRYRMTPDAIIAAARTGVALGYRTIVLQSGEDPAFSAAAIAAVIHALKELGLVVTLSLGERLPTEYQLWRQAGAERYLMRHETADPELYRRLHPGQSWQHRMRLLRILKELDYQVGTGFMVGLPGQSAETLLADLEYIQTLNAEMVGIGPFIPHPATPLGTAPGGTLRQTVLLVALARLTLPYALIPATTALGTIDPLGREAALQAGANVLMPNLTPVKYRSDYQIYPDKICIHETAADCGGCLAHRIEALGRAISNGPGHQLHWLNRR